jgi:long-subunit acyl-CoA synthetase (AMP-forming)
MELGELEAFVTVAAERMRASRRTSPTFTASGPHLRSRASWGGALNGSDDRAARALTPLGVQHGDRVGVWSGNRAEWEISAAELALARVTDVEPT